MLARRESRGYDRASGQHESFSLSLFLPLSLPPLSLTHSLSLAHFSSIFVYTLWSAAGAGHSTHFAGLAHVVATLDENDQVHRCYSALLGLCCCCCCLPTVFASTMSSTYWNDDELYCLSLHEWGCPTTISSPPPYDLRCTNPTPVPRSTHSFCSSIASISIFALLSHSILGTINFLNLQPNSTLFYLNIHPFGNVRHRQPSLGNNVAGSIGSE